MMSRRLSVPIRIETLLRRAARDETFRARLISDPLGAARSAGLDLSVSECTVLGALPGDQIARLVDRLAAS